MKRLLSDSVIYGLSGIISSFINIFLIPLYTKAFQPADYGIISILTTTFAFLNILLIFSMDNTAAVWFWDKEDHIERKKTFNTWLIFTAVGGLVLMIILLSLHQTFSKLFFDTYKYGLLFLLLGFNLALTGFQKIVNIWCRMLQKPIQAMLYSLALVLTTVGFNILFVLKQKVGVQGVFFSQLIASVLGVVLLIVLFHKWISPKMFRVERLKEMLSFSAPLVPATLLYWLMNMASVYFMKYFIKDTAEIGLYQVGASIANMLSLVTWAFFQAWSPFALSVSKEENAKRIYSLVFEVFCILGIFFSLSLFLTAKDVLLIFTNEKYLGAKDVIGLLAINVILQGIPNILVIANYLTKKNSSYALAIALGSIISVIGFIFFIPKFGKEGAALAMLIGNLFVPIYLGIKAQKLYYIPYRFDRIIFFIIIQASILISARYITEGLWKHVLVITIVGIIMFLLYLRIAMKAGLLRKLNMARHSAGLAEVEN